MLTLDKNNIISLGEEGKEGKEYTRTFFGYPYSAYDHTVLLYTKKGIEEKSWKDIGHSQSVFLARSKRPVESTYILGYARIGYDMYFVYDEETGEARNTAKPDIIVKPLIEKMFGTSSSALVMPSYDGCLLSQNIVSFLFGLALAHGTWMIRNGVLFPVKVTIPLTSSLLGQKDFFLHMAKVLREEYNLLHSMQFVHTGTYELVQLTIHDPFLLLQFSSWMNPIVNIEKISTVDLTSKACYQLTEYVQSQGDSLQLGEKELVLLQSD